MKTKKLAKKLAKAIFCYGNKDQIKYRSKEMEKILKRIYTPESIAEEFIKHHTTGFAFEFHSKAENKQKLVKIIEGVMNL
jgi:hypothetical protein